MAGSDAMFNVMAYGVTDVGLERKNNEDAFVSEPSAGLFVVCDGMGGHASGELASRITVESVVEFVTKTIHQDNFRWPFQSPNATTVETKVLDCAIRIANRKVFQEAQADARHKGMGTTVVAMLAGRDKIGAVHVGDSRIYRLRDGKLEQLTEDHSLLNHYKKTRPMSEDEIRNFKGKNVIVRAVGLRETVEPETHVWDYRSGDVFLLCTDGLTDLVADDYISGQMNQVEQSIKLPVTNLIQKALAAGGKDNVTVLMLQVEPGAGLDESTEEFAAIPTDADDEDTSPGFEARSDGQFWDQETMPGIPNGGLEPLKPLGDPVDVEAPTLPNQRDFSAAETLPNLPVIKNRALRITPDTVEIKVRRAADGSLQAMDEDTPDEIPTLKTRPVKNQQFGRTMVDKPPQMPMGRQPATVRVRGTNGGDADEFLSATTDRYDSVKVLNDETPEVVPVIPSTDE